MKNLLSTLKTHIKNHLLNLWTSVKSVFFLLAGGAVVLAVVTTIFLTKTGAGHKESKVQSAHTENTTTSENVEKKEPKPKWQVLECEGKELKIRPTENQGFKITPKKDSIRITKEIKLKNTEQAEIFAKNGAQFEIALSKNTTFKDIGGGVWYFSYQDPHLNESNFGDLAREQSNENEKTESNPNLFRIPKSSAKDAGGNFTNDVSIAISKEKDSEKTFASLTIKDKKWLTSPKRQFPVTVKFIVEVVPEKR
ncbi:MAG: hypothetical protein ACOC6Q_03050 [Patescibacteria group bacterium]